MPQFPLILLHARPMILVQHWSSVVCMHLLIPTHLRSFPNFHYSRRPSRIAWCADASALNLNNNDHYCPYAMLFRRGLYYIATLVLNVLHSPAPCTCVPSPLFLSFGIWIYTGIWHIWSSLVQITAYLSSCFPCCGRVVIHNRFIHTLNDPRSRVRCSVN